MLHHFLRRQPQGSQLVCQRHPPRGFRYRSIFANCRTCCGPRRRRPFIFQKKLALIWLTSLSWIAAKVWAGDSKLPLLQESRETATHRTLLAEERESPSTPVVQACLRQFGELTPTESTRRLSRVSLNQTCATAQVLPTCASVKAEPIFHFEKTANREKSERILVFGLVHGDEHPSGWVARAWIERLLEIDPQNAWRIVPILNPDGMKAKTRFNSRGVDINRNFPSKDWDELALAYWKEKTNSDVRRYPGPSAGSEPETACAMDHIKSFKPNLIIAIHTPYGVLDFDGPKIQFPNFKGLPWVSLGTFPGSLGRFLWTDQNTPVLTIELKQDLRQVMDRFDKLQDITGQMARMMRKVDTEKVVK